MNVGQILQRVSLSIATYTDSTEGERAVAEAILKEMRRLATEETSQYHLICHEGITSAGEEKYFLKIVSTEEIKQMEQNPFWNIICNQIDEQVDWAASGLADSEDERTKLATLWRHNQEIGTGLLTRYSEEFLKGMDVLKSELPKPKSWKIWSCTLLTAEVCEVAPLGIIYRVLTERFKQNMRWSGKTARSMLTVNRSARPPIATYDSGEQPTFQKAPALVRFYQDLEYYRRLLECKGELLSVKIPRQNSIIRAEFELTRQIEINHHERPVEFVDLDDEETEALDKLAFPEK